MSKTKNKTLKIKDRYTRSKNMEHQEERVCRCGAGVPRRAPVKMKGKMIVACPACFVLEDEWSR